MVTGTYLVANVPAPAAPQEAIAAYLVDGGNHMTNLIGAYVWVLGALAFLFLRACEASCAEPKVAWALCRTWPLVQG